MLFVILLRQIVYDFYDLLLEQRFQNCYLGFWVLVNKAFSHEKDIMYMYKYIPYQAFNS